MIWKPLQEIPEFGIVKKLVIHKKFITKACNPTVDTSEAEEWMLKKNSTKKKHENHIGLGEEEAACKL